MGPLLNSASNSRPSGRRPVPPSRIMIWPSARTSMQEVLPPYLRVVGPGVGTEPRTPQNFSFAGEAEVDVEAAEWLPISETRCGPDVIQSAINCQSAAEIKVKIT